MARPARARVAGACWEARSEVSLSSAWSSRDRRSSWVWAKVGMEVGVVGVDMVDGRRKRASGVAVDRGVGGLGDEILGFSWM